jgi:heme exporter protein CcmD
MAGPYAAYILAAYAITALAIAAMSARAIIGYRRRLRRIGELEAAGALRRGRGKA